VTPDRVETVEAVLTGFNDLLAQVTTLRAYVYCFVATNSRDETAQRELSRLQQEMVTLSILDTRLTAWIGSMDVEELIAESAVAADHAFALRRAKEEADHLMSRPEEELASRLEVTGGNAWQKLHGNYTSQIMVPFERDDEVQSLPITAIRNLAYDPDREIRQRAYEAELEAWEQHEVPIAAALNSIKGETNTLTARRKWESPLAEALFGSNIDRETLDAMMAAARESFPDFCRYLQAKAQALDLERLAWYDLFAPVGEPGRTWPFDEAADFVVEQFGTYSDRMADLATQAIEGGWMDAEPRGGKRGGAFCIRIREGESRIMLNYSPVYGEVSTMAHELGHAYHNLTQADLTPLQRITPMTLAETASIFCQTIVREAVLAEVGPAEQFHILEASLQEACQVVVDISSRFLFERSVFSKRKERELSASEFKTLMLEAQEQTYGDGLDRNALHPYMWAVKPHYYMTSYYNYPYMFGLLFGLGLYAQYREDPEDFKAGYDDLLASTGMYDAAELGERFGMDIRAPAFWRGSLDVIRDDIKRFEELVDGQAGS
jgi:pepF/M3 family oligoendopeptidase